METYNPYATASGELQAPKGACPAKIRIGTRASKLAVAQATEVKNRILGAFPELTQSQIEMVKIVTTGDKVQDRHLAEIGGKGLFTKEIEEGLLAGEIDLAVHSMKDMPAEFPEGLELCCILEREDPHDAFVSHKYDSIEALPEGAVVGTSSVRRQAQILSLRPDVKIVPFRGNVITRLEKLAKGDVDATLLAVAGLKRIDMQDAVTSVIPATSMIPAVAQGAIGVEIATENSHIRRVLDAINHTASAVCVAAERAFLRGLGGSCTTPMGCLATLNGDAITLEAMVAAPDGSQSHYATRTGALSEAESLGASAAEELKTAGANFLEFSA